MNDDAVDQLTRPAKTSAYAPHVLGGSRLGQLIDGRPRFTWLEAERMRLDPQIQFGLRILRAPLWGVTWKVHADKASVEGWVNRQLSHIYNRLLPRLCRFFEYGVACGEVTYRSGRAAGKTRVHFHDFLELHPRDTRPLAFDRGPRAGTLAGMRVSGASHSGSGSLYLDRRHSFWFKGEAEFGDWWGRPRLAGPYEPWLEKRGRGGAIDSRRLWYKKGAFRGPTMRYPIGRTNMGTTEEPFYVSNQDIARELVEKFENGGVMALPNAKDGNGNDLWRWEDPQSFADAAGFLEYPKQLDREILIGFGIPPELVDAATVGSGYSGRAIPAQVFFCSMDEIAAIIIEAIDRQILRGLVRWNFGPCGYEIKPDSLAQLVAKGSDQGAGKPPQQPGGTPSEQPDGNGMVPYQGPHGGQGFKNPKTGAVHYGKATPKIRLSLEAKKDRRARRRERIRMSWSPYQGTRGGSGWISDQGEVRYVVEKPADESTAGPESVFAHPELAKRGWADSREHDYAAARAKYHARAEADGIDPAQLHKDATERLEWDLHQGMGANGKPIDRPLEFHTSYESAHRHLIGEKEGKDRAAKFADGYFEASTPAKRAANYIKAMEGAGQLYSLDPDHLDEDTRAAIVEDLAKFPAPKLAAHLAHVADQYGTDDDSRKGAAWTIASEAARAVKPAPAPKFNPARLDTYYIVTADDIDALSDHDRAAFNEIQRLTPAAMSLGGNLVVVRNTPLEKVADAIGLTGSELDADEGLQKMFEGIAETPQLPQANVPASAKNFGTTSGALVPDKAPDDWNPNVVDTYKRIDKDGKWYVLKRGEHNASDSGETYSIVPKSALPPLSRLPAVYWKDHDTSPGVREDLVEEAEKRKEKATPEGAAAKKEIKATPKARDITKAAGKLEGEHKQTGNIVRSDESIRDRVRTWAGEYTFEAADATDDEDTPAVEALEGLEEALKDAYEHEPDHEYDPAEIDFEPDTSLLEASRRQEGTRAEHAEEANETAEMFETWHATTRQEVAEARAKTQSTSQEYRDQLRDKLKAVRQAAQAVLSLPKDRVSESAIEAAAQMDQGAMQVLGRLERKVKLSLAAGKLWEAASSPIKMEGVRMSWIAGEHPRDHGRFARKASTTAHEVTESVAEFMKYNPEEGHDPSEYIKPSKEARRNARAASNAAKSGDHKLAAEYHKDAADSHDEAADAHDLYSGNSVRQQEAVKNHRIAAKKHRLAWKSLTDKGATGG